MIRLPGTMKRTRMKRKRAIQGEMPNRRPRPAHTPPRIRPCRGRISPCRRKYSISFSCLATFQSPRTHLLVVAVENPRDLHIGNFPGVTPDQVHLPLSWSRGTAPWHHLGWHLVIRDPPLTSPESLREPAGSSRMCRPRAIRKACHLADS